MNQTDRKTARTNPYVGPRAFKYGEQLYGRDAEVPNLRDLLISERIVLLHAPSGAGKTSLVQAAMIPELEKNRFIVRPVLLVGHGIPGEWRAADVSNRYVASVAQSLEAAFDEDRRNKMAELAGQTLKQILDSIKPAGGDPVFEVLIFDQFEEIFTVEPTDQSAKREFFLQLGEVLIDEYRWALFAMREEYIAALTPFMRTIPSQLEMQFRLELLNEDQARRAIQEPAEAQGVEFEAAAARTLVDDLRKVQVQAPDGTTRWQTGPFVEPVQLQVVCRRLWDKHREANRITAADIGALEDVDAALAGYFEDSVAEVSAATGGSQRQIRNWFETALITKEGVRTRILKGPESSEGLDNQVIQAIVDTHLVRVEESQYRTWFELAHDRLVDPIRVNNEKWRELHLTRWQRQSALWQQQDRPDSLLLADEDFAIAEQWAAQSEAELSKNEQQYLERSRASLARSKRSLQQKRLIALSASIALVLLAVVGLYLFFESRAQLPWAYFRNLRTGVAHPALGGQATLGRSTQFQNTITAADPYNFISRMHVLVTRDRKAFDMRSLNGTTINANFLPYGSGYTLQSNDILTLAGMATFQFTRPDYPFYQFWRSDPGDEDPKKGWLLFIDGSNRNVIPLTAPQYYLSLDGEQPMVLSLEEKPGTLMRIASDDEYIVRVLDEKDADTLTFQFKGDDYTYPEFELGEGTWFRAYRFPWKDRYGDTQNTVRIPLNGVFRYERPGLSFQFVKLDGSKK